MFSRLLIFTLFSVALLSSGCDCQGDSDCENGEVCCDGDCTVGDSCVEECGDSDGPQCGGECPEDQVCAVSGITGGCGCIAFQSCGPTFGGSCGGQCPESSFCAMVTEDGVSSAISTCTCITNNPDCGDHGGVCGGNCPFGETCENSGGSCQCVGATPCGGTTANQCSQGECNIAGHECLFFDGRCECRDPNNFCGDGILNFGFEECDSGSLNGTPASNCDFNCNIVQNGVCGNGILEAGEECDPPSSEVWCTNCEIVPGCGNSIVENGEECDDGNTNPSDSCNNCRNPRCGDGVTQGNEQCDDGNSVSTDACVNCVSARCGDGFVWNASEDCDNGASNNWSGSCTPNCQRGCNLSLNCDDCECRPGTQCIIPQGQTLAACINTQ